MAKFKGTGKLNICKFSQNAKQKLDDLNETIAVDVVLRKHYEFILANFEAMQEKLDEEIFVIQQQKDHLLEQFISAPEKLTELAKHIDLLSNQGETVKDAATGRRKTAAKYKNLKERLAKMERQMEEDGIDVPDIEAKIKAEAEEN